MLKIVNCKTGVGVLSALALSTVGVCIGSTLAFGDMQDADGSSQTCGSSVGINYAPLSSNVCQSSSSTTYRLSRWVYYAVNTSNLPTDSNGKKYIPPIGIANSGNGVADGLEGWLIVEPGMSDCIVANGGFWRRGYFQSKTNIYQERTYNGLTFGATQNGVAPIGFTGRSSDNIQTADQVGINSNPHTVGEFLGGWDGSLGQHTLYNGNQTKVWAKMDTTKGAIGDSAALALYRSFNNTTDDFDYGDYFMSTTDGQDAGDATVLFCYSDGTPYDGQVQIGSSNSVYAYHSKKNGEDAKKGLEGGSGDATNNTINLGEVNSENYTPGHVFMKIEKAKEKSGNTKYKATMSLNGAIKYSFDGSNWASSDKANEKDASATVSTSLSPSFTLAEGDNTICINLDYKEKPGDSDYQKLKACAKVKYSPSVAEIDSVTTLKIGSNVITSEVDKPVSYSLGDNLSYGANAISAEWSYLLSSSKRCFEGDFKNGACSENKTSITSSFKVPFNRVGDVVNNTGESTLSSPGYSAAPEANSKSYDLLPGESIRQKQGISHKSGVRADGTTANGAIDESSSVELTAKAKDAICSLNNKPFGLTNSVNYGRLTVIKNDNRSYVSGNNFDGENAIWSTANTVWLDPNDTVKLTYEACIGEQISRDKNSGKAWSDDNKDNNVLLAVGTTGSLLNNSHYKNIEASAVDLDSAEGRNIGAYEKIGTTINTHVANGYQFTGSNAASSGSAIVGNVGKVIDNDFGNLDTNGNGSYLSGCPAGSNCYARVTMKIPYNYILNPTISTSKGIVTIGDETKFEVSVRRDERSNQQVDTSKTYKTEVKTATKAKYVTFRLPSDIKYSDLNTWAESHETPDGDITDNLDGFIRASLHSSIGIMGGGELSSADINADKKAIVTVSADDADTDFNKLCVIAGVYPADSHNSRAETIDSENQDNALMDGAGSGAFTRISVSCKTVGKYPTTSVEGNGIVAGGSVIGANTTYTGRNYGSWTEYGLIANSVQNFASGASAAYTNPQTTINASAAGNPGGIKTEYLDSPQTLGNMSADVGLRDDAEAKLRASQMQSYVEDVKATFFAGTPGGSETIKQFNNKTYVNTNYNGDVEISPSLANDINAKANNGLVIIYSTGDIRISNGVQELNAVLIADGKVDTCSEGDQGGDNGELLDNCYNPLVINGVVFSNESIALDRVYGGGSTDGMNLNADSLIQRAEIFNFDPEIVNWGYNYKFENQAITTTYIEELSTRY